MFSANGHLTILESVDSTNNYAMAMVRTGMAKHGDGFFALEQVKGKGQHGKTWVTEPGTNIILTLVLQPLALQLNRQFELSMAIALGVYDFFSHYAGDETTIKWPNDIYWRDRKAGGILIESIVGNENQVQGSGFIVPNSRLTEEELRTSNHELQTSWRWAIVGMGININQTSFPENIRNAVSLKQITGKNWDVIELAKKLSDHVQNRFAQLLAGKNLLIDYNNHLFKKGQTVKLKKENRVFEALIKEVTKQGQLIAVTGVEEHFNFGEVEWILDR